jgi:H+/Na+-translocating ferredoxin:NAD+ oxidoreductase subunit C
MNLLDVMKTPAARVPRPTDYEPELKYLPDPEVVTIPLEYPGHELLQPLVQAGEEVARLQVIGRSERGNCVHASIGGKVREISRVWTATGHQVPAVIIERGDVTDLSPSEALARCDLDAASATRVQLLMAGGVISPWSTPKHKADASGMVAFPEIKHVVIQGHDEEPTLHVQEILLQARADVLKDSLRLLRDVAPQAEVTLTVDSRMAPWARETFGEALKIFSVSKQYRHRLVRILVPKLTGVSIPAVDPFCSHGVAVMTVENALAAQHAFDGTPFVSKKLTISGGPIDKPVTVSAALGTSFATILKACGVVEGEIGRVLAGGPMQGTALYTEDTPLDKFQDGIHLLAVDELPAEVNLNCVNCGRCVRACPANLQVHLIGRSVEFDLKDEAESYFPEVCLECGLCAFVCPARRPLVQLVRLAKTYRRK